MFIFCPETVVCFIIYPIALDHMEAHTMIMFLKGYPLGAKTAPKN